MQAVCVCVDISIHALRVEGDVCVVVLFNRVYNFYPRPPGGGRLNSLTTRCISILFLSTPSGWRATKQATDDEKLVHISIHALRVEGDSTLPIRFTSAENFYPRPPGGGRRSTC